MKVVGDLGCYGVVEVNLDKFLFCEIGGYFMFYRNIFLKYIGVEKFYVIDFLILLV